MSSLMEYYKILGVSAGAGMVDITTSYRRLCRLYHPDINSDPDSEELMKRINVAYSALREKFGREAAFRERPAGPRAARRHSASDIRQYTESAKASAEKEAFSALNGYFKAIADFDYHSAYDYLSDFDKRHTSQESFVKWRMSVTRLFPMREFKITLISGGATMTFNDGKTFIARKYRVEVVEEDVAEDKTQSGEVEKLVIYENGKWRVFLGHKDISGLTRTFDERLEAKRKRDIAKSWEEYYGSLCPEYNMLSLAGMRKAVSRELYRQKRYGCAITFAAVSVKPIDATREGAFEEVLRSAGKSISRTIRETDVSAYVGDGVFVLLLVELRKKHAAEVVGRLLDKIRFDAGKRLAGQANIECAFESFAGHADKEAFNKVLRKFHKKL